MDDYIKREDVIEALYRSCDSICPYSLSERKMVCGSCTRGKVFDVIKNEIPAADVRENVYADCLKLNNDPYIMWKCGNCGLIRERTSKPKFCEECGAEFLPAVRGEKYV